MSAVIGQDNVIRMMVAVGEGARGKMNEVMAKVGFDIQQHVQSQKLSGQVLNRRTGVLRNSIHPRVQDSAASVSAVVGTNVKYAAAHEYGFQGTVTVPAHTRMQTMAFGRPMSKLVTVRAHPMKMNLPERSFLRSSLQDKAPEEIERIRVSMAELIAQAQS